MYCVMYSYFCICHVSINCRVSGLPGGRELIILSMYLLYLLLSCINNVSIIFIYLLFYPWCRVSGLPGGREFTLVVMAANSEGQGPPVALSAFTLKDQAQTLLGEAFRTIVL